MLNASKILRNNHGKLCYVKGVKCVDVILEIKMADKQRKLTIEEEEILAFEVKKYPCLFDKTEKHQQNLFLHGKTCHFLTLFLHLLHFLIVSLKQSFYLFP